MRRVKPKKITPRLQKKYEDKNKKRTVCPKCGNAIPPDPKGWDKHMRNEHPK